MNYLIENTTKEQREELVYNALGISLAEADRPSEKTLSLVQKYIDGELELEEIRKILIKEYTNNGE